MTLNISCTDMTRATEAGIDYFNENVLKTLDIFYYRDSTDADCFEHDRLSGNFIGSASYTKHLEILTKEKFFGTGTMGSCYVYVIANGPQTDIDNILNADTASVANLKKIVLTSPDLGNSEVKDNMGDLLVSQKKFVMDGGATMTYSNNSASVDVKLARSLAKIQLYVYLADTVKVNGKSYMPSIISVNSTSKKAWGKAVFSNGLMRGYINDSDTSNAYSPSAADYYPASGLSYDEKARYIRQDTLAATHQSSDGTYTYYSHSPFYTYPMTWDTFSDSLTTRPTSLMLVVDWYTKGSGGMSAKTTFYTIDVNMKKDTGEEYKFKRNTFYKVYADVETLGSDSSTDPVEIAGECEILDWNHVNQESSIENLRYLTVDQNKYVLDNENTLYIPYSTSHDCEITGITVSQIDATDRVASLDTLADDSDLVTSGDSGYSTDFTGYDADIFGSYVIADDHNYNDNSERPFSFKITDKYIIFQHVIDNRTSISDSQFDYVPFEIEFTLRHITDTTYSETIHITQHPELSIEPERNSDFVDFEAADYDAVNNTHTGYVYVNGYNYYLGEDDEIFQDLTYTRIDNDSYAAYHALPYLVYSNGTSFGKYDVLPIVQLGEVSGISSNATNANPNRYKVRAALPAGYTDRIIGNPLSGDYDLLKNINYIYYSSGYYYTSMTADWTKKARYITDDGSVSSDSDTRLMQYYVPARESGELPDASKIVAPKFMIASSYGVTTRIYDAPYYSRSYRERAERRCASYQEEGYPAGRWRLPTSAEVEFLVQLSNKNLIPKLFGNGASYWTSTGWVTTYVGSDPKVYESTSDYNGWQWMYVRCVYDLWYWGDDMPLEKENFTNSKGQTVNGYRFTWGDMPR